MLAGEGIGVGIGAVLSSGGKPVDVADWYEGRPSFSTHQQESQWGLTEDVAVNTSGVSANSNDRSEGSGASFADVPPAGGRSEGEEQAAEIDAGQEEEGTKTAGEGVCALNRINRGDDLFSRETGVYGEGTEGGAAAAAATATTEAQGDNGAMPAADRGGHDEGVPHRVDAGGASHGFIGTARPGDGNAQAEWAETASNGPERPPYSTPTRCLSYTVKLPWDGYK